MPSERRLKLQRSHDRGVPACSALQRYRRGAGPYPGGPGDFPVPWEGRQIGSLGLGGAEFPQTVLHAIAHRLAIAVARARAIREGARIEALHKGEELKSAIFDALAHEIDQYPSGIDQGRGYIAEVQPPRKRNPAA